jgi:transcriptional regulator with XRE-family HTH domain
MDESALVAERLSSAVKAAKGNLSLRQFSEAIGVSTTTIRGWIKQETLPSFESLAKIAAWRDELPEEFVSFLYGRKISGTSMPAPTISLTALHDRIQNATLAELAEVSKAIAERLEKEKGSLFR